MFLFLIFLTAKLFCATQTYTTERGTFKIDVPEYWQSVNDLYGMPVSLLGPMKNGRRPVITVTPTGIDHIRFDSKSLKKNFQSYKEGREQWLKTRGGKSIKYYPYLKEDWAPGLTVHHTGYEYAIGEFNFAERTYFALCGEKLFHLKSLVRLEKREEKDFEVTAVQTIRSFRCSAKENTAN